MVDTAELALMVHEGTLYPLSSHARGVGEIGDFNMKDQVRATTTSMAQIHHTFDPNNWPLSKRVGYPSFVTSRVNSSLTEARNRHRNSANGEDFTNCE